MVPKIYSRFNPPLVSGLTCVKPSLTSQEFKEECNINVLLKKYAVQAKLLGLPLSEVLPQPTSENFGDFTNVEDYQTAMNRAAQVKEMFDSLPSELRKECGNDPAIFLEKLHDDSNFKRFAEMGILNSEEVNTYFERKNASVAAAKSADKSAAEPAFKSSENSEG